MISLFSITRIKNMKFLVKLVFFFEVQIKTKIIFYIKKFIVICDTNLKFLF